MQNRWSEAEAAKHHGLIGECVYVSRLLGSDRALVSHGGGNTSVKLREADVHGDPRDVLYVKGSGWELAAIEPEGFAPLDLARVRRLADLDALSDTDMVDELLQARVRSDAPDPSVESIIHAILPATAVVHAHPNALLAVANTPSGPQRVRDLYGPDVLVVPYAMPGFRAAKELATRLAEVGTDYTSIVLLSHGVVSVGETPREAYDRLIDLVDIAERYVQRFSSERSRGSVRPQPPVERLPLAQLRFEVSRAAGRPCLMRQHRDQTSWAFSQRDDLAAVSRQGVATPDHALWTKPLPMLGRDVATYADGYRDYVSSHSADRDVRQRDPAPRVILDRDLGLLTAGPSLGAESASADIYTQIIDTIEMADGLGGFQGLPASDIFDLEYWELEQRKLDRVGVGDEFTGEVALVSGANSGIGRGCALALLDRGAAVVGVDVNPAVVGMTDHAAYIGVQCDVSSLGSLEGALDAAVERFGGVDMVVAAAGLFPESGLIVQHDPSAWTRAMSVNVDGLIRLFSLVQPLLALSPRKGRVVVIGSKNVRAPGPGASAYSASKAAANQIARVAALEWAADGIRVSSVHPDAVFDTALWTEDLLLARAAKYGLSVEDYKRRNLMGVEITSAQVGELVAVMLGRAFAATTGAHVTIDGGNERTI
jgi:rhamnose utilization protein RhaD (predicted bifunctional aldolase and dehydrogenase)/NAD(P)-dependent dehydrogenase (short-subunit alcohol dehydrogenase family)